MSKQADIPFKCDKCGFEMNYTVSDESYPISEISKEEIKIIVKRFDPNNNLKWQESVMFRQGIRFGHETALSKEAKPISKETKEELRTYYLKTEKRRPIRTDDILCDIILNQTYARWLEDRLISKGAKPISVENINKIISNTEDERSYKEAGNRDSYSEYNEGWTDACDILGERIKVALSQGAKSMSDKEALLEWPCQQLLGGTGAGIYSNIDGLCKHPECHPSNNDIPAPEISEEEIEKEFPYEVEMFMFKASDSYNLAQKHRREGAKWAISKGAKPASEISKEKIKELVDALNELCNEYIANMGTKDEFIVCITPEGIPDYWQKAKAALKELKQ